MYFNLYQTKNNVPSDGNRMSADHQYESDTAEKGFNDVRALKRTQPPTSPNTKHTSQSQSTQNECGMENVFIIIVKIQQTKRKCICSVFNPQFLSFFPVCQKNCFVCYFCQLNNITIFLEFFTISILYSIMVLNWFLVLYEIFPPFCRLNI